MDGLKNFNRDLRMKNTLPVLYCSIAVSFSAFAGEIGPIATANDSTYISITGGDYSSQYQANYTKSVSGVTTRRESFNDTNNNGFGQIAVGTSAQIGTFKFDHQAVASVLGGGLSFNTASSKYTFKQQVDFGYDFMPKLNMNIVPKLDMYGILGVHYGHFVYLKSSSSVTSETYDVSRNQVGFNLGVGLSYLINAHLAAGIKYQYWQYGATDVYGTNALGTSNEIEHIPASFNLVGLELRYFI